MPTSAQTARSDVLADVLAGLEPLTRRPGFAARWRAFLRACSLELLPRLPAEARAWFDAADAYEAGRASPAELTAVRVLAWRHVDRRAGSLAGQSGLRAVMHRLWPDIDGGGDWYESALHFLDCCEDAGLPAEQWGPLLRERFPELADDSPA